MLGYVAVEVACQARGVPVRSVFRHLRVEKDGVVDKASDLGLLAIICKLVGETHRVAELCRRQLVVDFRGSGAFCGGPLSPASHRRVVESWMFMAKVAEEVMKLLAELQLAELQLAGRPR